MTKFIRLSWTSERHVGLDIKIGPFHSHEEAVGWLKGQGFKTYDKGKRPDTFFSRANRDLCSVHQGKVTERLSKLPGTDFVASITGAGGSSPRCTRFLRVRKKR